MNWITPLILLIIFESFADIFAKEYSLKNSPWFWVGAILLYVLANSFWLYAIKSGSGLARGAVLFSVASAILALFIGLVFYKEPFNSTQILGMVIGLVAIILILWGDLRPI